MSSQPGKNLRFFGDTDIESNATYTRTWKDKFNKQPSTSSSALTKNRNYSQSAYDLNAAPKKVEPAASSYRSSSLHNLEKVPDAKQKHTERYVGVHRFYIKISFFLWIYICKKLEPEKLVETFLRRAESGTDSYRLLILNHLCRQRSVMALFSCR